MTKHALNNSVVSLALLGLALGTSPSMAQVGPGAGPTPVKGISAGSSGPVTAPGTINYAVGTCRPSLPSYSTISAAVSAVPPGSVIGVCPNTYHEQVFITESLTLQGIASGNTSDVVITTPSSGLTTVIEGLYGLVFAPLVSVSNGTVNLTNITLDGTGNNISCTVEQATYLVGIFYENASGTVNQATVRNLQTVGCLSGTGAWVEASGGGSVVTIENSSFANSVEFNSVVTDGAVEATVKNNYMASPVYGICACSSGGSVTGNVIDGSGAGGIVVSAATTITNNTVTNSGWGIVSYVFGGGATVQSNRIANAVYGGIYAEEANDTYKNNTITHSVIGVEFNCNANTVTSNTINDASIGLDQVPATYNGINTYSNVATIRNGGCAGAAQSPAAVSAGGPSLPASGDRKTYP